MQACAALAPLCPAHLPLAVSGPQLREPGCGAEWQVAPPPAHPQGVQMGHSDGPGLGLGRMQPLLPYGLGLAWPLHFPGPVQSLAPSKDRSGRGLRRPLLYAASSLAEPALMGRGDGTLAASAHQGSERSGLSRLCRLPGSWPPAVTATRFCAGPTVRSS